MPSRRQRYIRKVPPPPMRLTSRDKAILETIHTYDGLLNLKQIDQLFFSGKGRSQPRARMRLLFDNGYVAMPDTTTIHQVPFGETIFWLTNKGASVVAAMQGKTARQLSWKQKPRYSLIDHDLAINDFRISVLDALEQTPDLELMTWLPESEFAAQPDKINYRTSQGKVKRCIIRPDGFFVVRRMARWGQTQLFAFLLEVDMGSEDNPRFAREKVRPGVAYLGSVAYQDRFGLRYGRYLVITTGQRRLQNMKAHAERAGGTGLFYFTTFDAIQPVDLFNNSIWWLAGEDSQRALIA